MVLPSHVPLKGGAVSIVMRSLLKRRLLGEVLAGEGDHVWWRTPAGQPHALRVTDAGLVAAGLVEATVASAKPATDMAARAQPHRAGTKQAALIGLLRREEGATIDEMVEATGWLPHTVRGAMAGALKKRLKMEVTSVQVEGRGRVYHVGS